MEHKLETYMVKAPFICVPDLPLAEASKMMRELNFRHLPVIENSCLVGVISERDLREAMAYPRSENLLVQDIMKREVYSVTKDSPLKKVVRDMADYKMGSAVVVNNHKEVVGIFTTTDALKILAELLEAEGERDVYLTADCYETWPTFNAANL